MIDRISARLGSFAGAVALAGLTVVASPLGAQTRPQDRPMTVGQSFLADSLDPAQGAAGWALQSHGVGETLFTVARDGRVVPNLARSVVREGTGFVVELVPDLRFSDGAPLDAAALMASLARTMRENPRARAQTGMLEMAVVDALRLRLQPERAVAAIESVLAEFPLVIHRADGNQFHATGPFRAVEFRRGEFLRLEPNPHYRVPAARPHVTIRRIGDAQTLALGLESGEIDIAFNLAPETLPRLRQRPGITVKSTPVAYQYMLLLNAAKAPFDDVRVRRAVDLAVERATLVAAVNGGEIASGLYPRFFPFATQTPRATDAAAAAALLDAAGWQRGPNGQRAKGGQPLEIVLTSYPQRPDLPVLAPVVRANLERVGFRVRLESTEAITPQLQAKRFDAAFWAMHAAPGGDGAFVLEQYVRTGAATNFMSFASPGVDAAIDALRKIDAPDARNAAVRGIEAQLFAEAPIVALMTPVWHVGLSARATDYVPYPSDYYVVRADLRQRN